MCVTIEHMYVCYMAWDLQNRIENSVEVVFAKKKKKQFTEYAEKMFISI